MSPRGAIADALHAGAANPLLEGWTVESGDGGTATPVRPDPDYPDVEAWQVATSSGDRLRYRVDPPAPGSVWSLRARLRVVDVADPVDFNTLLEVADGATRWLVAFGSESDGDSLVEPQGLAPFVVPTSMPGITDYVWIELASDPATSSVDVFANGSPVETGWEGTASTLSRVNFGDGQTSGDGRARYARVELVIAPHACSDGLDNDADGVVDLAGGDPDCAASNDPSEDRPDHDGDGLLDGYELANGLDPDDPDENANLVLDGEEDLDGDGLTNLEEQAAGTAVFDVDTDGDGLEDGAELASSGFGPANPLPVAVSFDPIPEIEPADLDGDGDMDLLSVEEFQDNVWWHENTDGAGSFGAPIPIQQETPEIPLAAKAADFDGDADLDVVAIWRSTRVGWWENVDGAGDFGPRREITDDVASSLGETLEPADVDGDGDMDVVAATTEELAWLENVDGAGSFVVNPISASLLGLTAIVVVDLDADEDPDVLLLGASPFVGWLENLDGLGGFSAIQPIDATVSTTRADLDAADFDGDDDVDVLAASADEIAWYEGDRGFGFGMRQVVSSVGAGSVRVADVDGDADVDFVASRGDRIEWFENVDGDGGFVVRPVAEAYAAGTWDIDVADFDGDGDPDVVAAAYDLTSLSNRLMKIVWFENRSLTDPLDADTDGDGLCDGGGPLATAPECALGGEDTNGNGVYDVGSETSPRDADTDNDGFDDGEEVAAGSDPLDPNSIPVALVPASSWPGRIGLTLALLGASALVLGRQRDRRAFHSRA